MDYQDTLSFMRAPSENSACFSFNAKMLVIAREMRKLTQAELATQLKISQPLIGKWEAGLSSPSKEQIVGLAEVLKVQVELFSIDRSRRLASMSDFYHRALSKARRADVKAVHARCSIIDIQIDRLLNLHGVLPDRIPSIDPENHAGDIEKVAAMARVALNVPAGPIANLVEVIEGNGGIVVDREIEVEEIDALCRWVPELPKIFFINGFKSADRIRFSLAHELAHTVMHFDRDRDLAVAEKEAQAFASAFLMPAKEFKRDIRSDLGMADLASLKRKWRVSMQAIVYRAKAVGAIDDRRFDSLYVQFSRNGWRKTEPVTIAAESPTVLRSLLQKHVESGYTVGELAKLLFVTEDEVQRMLVDAGSPSWAENGVRMRIVRD